MIIVIDGQTYSLNLTKTMLTARAMYDKLATDGIIKPDGTIIKFGDKSLARTAFKTLMTPFVIPLIKKLYTDIDEVLEPPIPHQDLIDYCVHAFIDYIRLGEKGVKLDIITSEVSDNSIKTIVSLTPSKIETQRAISASATPETHTEND